MSDKREPWMKWYPADWRQEPSLRLCSRAARSLWIDMLGLMHEAEPYGHLMVKGVPLDAAKLALVLGDPEKDVRKWLAELETAGVFSRNDAGTIFSRRMLRDKAKVERNRQNGKEGGNPKLKGSDNRNGGGEVNPEVNHQDKAQMPDARYQKPEEESPPPSSSEAHQEKPVPGHTPGRARENSGDALGLDLPDGLDRTPDEAVRLWNEMAQRCDLPSVQRLTEPRRRSLKARLSECGGLEGWKAALAKVEASDFLTGAGERGWKADFDFVLQAKSFTKLMEGGYDRSNRAPAEREDRTMAAVRGILGGANG